MPSRPPEQCGGGAGRSRDGERVLKGRFLEAGPRDSGYSLLSLLARDAHSACDLTSPDIHNWQGKRQRESADLCLTSWLRSEWLEWVDLWTFSTPSPPTDARITGRPHLAPPMPPA